MLSFLKKLFTKKNSDKIPTDRKIINRINECNKAIINYEQDIYKLKKKIQELAKGILFVPENQEFNLYKNIDKIINLPQNKNIDENIKLQTRQIIENYTIQINIREEKIEVCKQMIKKLKKMLSEYYSKMAKLQKIQKQIQLLKKHSKDIQLSDNQDNSKHIKEIISIEHELKQLEDNFQTKKILLQQLSELYYKYGTSENFDNTTIYAKQVKQIISELNKLIDNE